MITYTSEGSLWVCRIGNQPQCVVCHQPCYPSAPCAGCGCGTCGSEPCLHCIRNSTRTWLRKQYSQRVEYMDCDFCTDCQAHD